MTFRACFGSFVSIETIRTNCKTTAVGSVEEEVSGTGSCIKAFFGIVDTGFALNTAGLASVKNVGIDELANGASCPTSVGPNVFVVRCVSRGSRQVSVDSDDCDVFACLTVGQTQFSAGCASWSALSTLVVICFFIEIRTAVLNAFVIFQKDNNSIICESTRCTFLGIINTCLTIRITYQTLKTRGISICPIRTGIRADCRSINQKMRNIGRILLTSGT